MALKLINVDASGQPTCHTESDGSIDIGGIASGKFGYRCMPVVRVANPTDTSIRVNSTTSYSVPINLSNTTAFSGINAAGFTVGSIGTGSIVTPYDGVYRLRSDVHVGADLPASGYDENSTYQFQLRTSSSLIYMSLQLDMTGIQPAPSGSAASANKYRGEEVEVYLAAGVNIRALLKLFTGGGGHYHAASVVNVEYLGPGTQTI